MGVHRRSCARCTSMGSDQLIRRFFHFGLRIARLSTVTRTVINVFRGILIFFLKGVYLFLQLLYLSHQYLSTLLQSLLDYRSEFGGIHFMYIRN
jgi:hypothetical protein